MAHDNLTYDDLLRIVELIKTSEQFSEFRLKIGEIEVELRRRNAPGTPATAPASPSPSPAAPPSASPLSASPPSASPLPASPPSASPLPASPPSASPLPASPPSASPLPASASSASSLPAVPAAAQAAASSPARAAPTWPEASIVIRAPMVGIFYRSPQPGAPPFVDVGDPVGADTVVCIIEVMKLMSSIAAGAPGTITHILVDDAAPVEAGQPLIVLQPAPSTR